MAQIPKSPSSAPFLNCRFLSLSWFRLHIFQFCAFAFCTIALSVAFLFWKSHPPLTFSDSLYLNVAAQIHAGGSLWHPTLWGNPIAAFPPPAFWPLALVTDLHEVFFLSDVTAASSAAHAVKSSGAAQVALLFGSARFFSALCLGLLCAILCFGFGAHQSKQEERRQRTEPIEPLIPLHQRGALSAVVLIASGFPLFWGFGYTPAALVALLFAVVLACVRTLFAAVLHPRPVQTSRFRFATRTTAAWSILFAAFFILILLGEIFVAASAMWAAFIALCVAKPASDSFVRPSSNKIFGNVPGRVFATCAYVAGCSLVLAGVVLWIGNGELFQLYVTQFLVDARYSSAHDFPLLDKQGSFMAAFFLAPLVAWIAWKTLSARNLWAVVQSRPLWTFLTVLCFLFAAPLFSQHSFRTENALCLAVALSVLSVECLGLKKSESRIASVMARFVGFVFALIPLGMGIVVLNFLSTWAQQRNNNLTLSSPHSLDTLFPVHFRIQELLQELGSQQHSVATIVSFERGLQLLVGSSTLLFLFFAIRLFLISPKTTRLQIWLAVSAAVVFPCFFPAVFVLSVQPYLAATSGALVKIAQYFTFSPHTGVLFKPSSQTRNATLRTVGVLDPLVEVLLYAQTASAPIPLNESLNEPRVAKDLAESLARNNPFDKLHGFQFAEGDSRAFDTAEPLFLIVPNWYTRICTSARLVVLVRHGIFTLCTSRDDHL